MDPREFTLRGPGDFVRLDTRCADLLTAFFRWLQGEAGGGLPPDRASALAHAADRYLRDFVVDIKQTGPTDADPTLPRQYVGNWYLIHTLEPTHAEIDRILDALTRLYAFLAAEGLATPETARAVAETLAHPPFFYQRLESFWDLEPDEIEPWRAVDDYRRRRTQA